jgi:hypothetical protein
MKNDQPVMSGDRFMHHLASINQPEETPSAWLEKLTNTSCTEEKSGN